MATNSFAQLVQDMINEEAIQYLRTRTGFLDKIYITTIQEDQRLGGDSVIITLPSTTLEAQDVNLASPNAAQNIVLPSATLNFSNWEEVPISLTELEARIVRGNEQMIIKNVTKNMMDALLRNVDAAIAAEAINAAQTVGTFNTDITDPTLREGMVKLMNNNVDPSQGQTYFVTSPKGYGNDLLGIDRYVTPVNVGQFQDKSVVVQGSIAKLFNIGVDYSNNIETFDMSGGTSQYSLLFEKYAIAMGIMKFAPVGRMGESIVQESYITDPVTGLQIRSWVYLDPNTRTWMLKYDLKWGVTTLDANRMVSYLHSAT